MSDPFAQLIPETRAFLAALAAENTRDWFTAHKAEYESQLKRPAQLLLDQVAGDLGRSLGLPLNPRLFRAQRDLRFSKDKTPYHTHLHLLWALPGLPDSGFFFGVSTEYITLGGGTMAFAGDRLDRWRRAVDGPEGAEIAARIASLSPDFAPRAPELKRVPAPWPADHPRADLLRHKGLGLWHPLDAAEQAAPLAALLARFTQLAPLVRRLAEV